MNSNSYKYKAGEEIAIGCTRTVRVVKALAQGGGESGDDWGCDAKIEVYEVEDANDGHREIVVCDNVCRLVLGRDPSDDYSQDCNRADVQRLINAEIPPAGWVDSVEDEQLRDYVRACVADCWPYWSCPLCDYCNDVAAPYEEELTAWYDAHDVEPEFRRTMWEMCNDGPAWRREKPDRNPYGAWCAQHDIADYMKDGEVDNDKVALDYMTDDFAAYDAEIRAEFRAITGVDPEDVARGED